VYLSSDRVKQIKTTWSVEDFYEKTLEKYELASIPATISQQGRVYTEEDELRHGLLS